MLFAVVVGLCGEMLRVGKISERKSILKRRMSMATQSLSRLVHHPRVVTQYAERTCRGGEEERDEDEGERKKKRKQEQKKGMRRRISMPPIAVKAMERAVQSAAPLVAPTKTRAEVRSEAHATAT